MIAPRYATEYRRCLLEADVAGLMRLSEVAEPHLPRMSAVQAAVAMHQARTMAKGIPAKLVTYSRRWLEERARLPAQPVISDSVGVASICGDRGLRAALTGGMTRTVSAAIADGVPAADAKTLRPLILDARWKIKRGRISI